MFSGSLVAIITPMQRDGSIDFAAWSRLIDFHLDNGTTGIVVGGTTGESATLTDTELVELTRHACRQVARRIPVIAGAGSSSTAATIERARRLAELPLDALLIVTPAYNRPTQEGLYRHFAAVAQAVNVPLIAYNIPSRTAVDLLPATAARLAQLPGVVGVKEGVGRVERIRELCALCGEGFDVLSGDDASAREAVLAGARGVISVTANVAPRPMADMIAAALRADCAAAAALDAQLAPLHKALFAETNPIPAKWALAHMGKIGDGIRLPLTPLSAEHHAVVAQALQAWPA